MSSLKVPDPTASDSEAAAAQVSVGCAATTGSRDEALAGLFQSTDGQDTQMGGSGMGGSVGCDTVLYDGQCRFCIRQIANLRRFDGGGRLRFISLHDPSVAIDYPDLTKEQLMEEMWVVTQEGERFGGAYAVRYLTKRLPLLWPLYPWMRIPFSMPIWCWMYRQIAKRRYRIAGRDCQDGSCSLHG